MVVVVEVDEVVVGSEVVDDDDELVGASVDSSPLHAASTRARTRSEERMDRDIESFLVDGGVSARRVTICLVATLCETRFSGRWTSPSGVWNPGFGDQERKRSKGSSSMPASSSAASTDGATDVKS